MLRVTDGDTLVVLGPGNAQHKVRLAGIDAPELDQRYGPASKDHLSRRVAGRFVVMDWDKRDRYKRVVGKVLLGYLAVWLDQARTGLTWHDKRYQDEQTPSDRLRYAEAEQEAQDARRGLWADSDPFPSCEWRSGTKAAEDEPAGCGPAPGSSPAVVASAVGSPSCESAGAHPTLCSLTGA